MKNNLNETLVLEEDAKMNEVMKKNIDQRKAQRQTEQVQAGELPHKRIINDVINGIKNSREKTGEWIDAKKDKLRYDKHTLTQKYKEIGNGMYDKFKQNKPFYAGVAAVTGTGALLYNKLTDDEVTENVIPNKLYTNMEKISADLDARMKAHMVNMKNNDTTIKNNGEVSTKAMENLQKETGASNFSEHLSESDYSEKLYDKPEDEVNDNNDVADITHKSEAFDGKDDKYDRDPEYAQDSLPDEENVLPNNGENDIKISEVKESEEHCCEACAIAGHNDSDDCCSKITESEEIQKPILEASQIIGSLSVFRK